MAQEQPALVELQRHPADAALDAQAAPDTQAAGAAPDTQAACAEARLPGEDEWSGVLRHSVAAYMEREPDGFRRLVRRGVPPARRWQVWKEAVRLGGPGDSGPSARYDTLRGQRSSEFAELIEVDVRRTFPKDEDFTEERRRLASDVLNAYAIWDPVVGYCQGMNYLAGLLALLTDVDVEIFTFFVRLMQHFMLSGFFSDGFPLLRRYVAACQHVLERSEPALHSHLLHSGVHVSAFLLKWLQALFVTSLPVSAAMQLWDVVICDGLSVLVPVTVSIMHVAGDSLLQKPGLDLQQFFRKTSTYIGRDEVAEAMQRIDLVEIPDYVPAYLEDAEAFSGLWERLKRRFLPWTHRQRGVAALLDCAQALDDSPA